MTLNEMIPAFEAVLFASGEPVEIDRFCQIFEIDDETVVKVMDMLADRYEEMGSSVKVVRLDFSYQLCTKKEYAEYIRTALDLRRRTPLSQAAFE
ncbi:MAG: SMC-Scp complex subunit ScpB, partial [Clostridia bacterium]|nr:SMC-Scp complex subunit ScpB [Clostridia bacterium]